MYRHISGLLRLAPALAAAPESADGVPGRAKDAGDEPPAIATIAKAREDMGRPSN